MNKYNFLKYILCIALSMLCCLSCYEDKGNYDYVDINKVEIEGLEDKYTIGMEEAITIKPIHKSSIAGNEDHYKYEWICISLQIGTTIYRNYVVSTDKYLENKWLKLPGGSYTFYYKVTDTKTGIEWFSKNFTIEVLNEITKGFVILSDVDNKTRVDYISNFNDNLNLKLDVLSKVNSKYPDFGQPISVACYADPNSPKMNATTEDGQYAVCILTTTGAYRLHPGNFTYDPLYNLSYNYIGSAPSDFIAMRIYDGTFLVDNSNNLYYYYRVGNLFWTMGIYTNVTVDNKFIKIGPEVASFGLSGAVMYDVDTKSFVCHKNRLKYSGYYSSSDETEFDGLLFKFNNTGKDVMYLFGRSTTAYTLMKDPVSNEVFLGAFNYTTGVQSFYIKLNLPDLLNAKEYAMGHYAANSTIDQFLYYRTDNKIYMYNMSDGDNKLVYTAPSGNIITSMKFNKNGTWKNYLNVATYDPSKPKDSCGKFEILEVTPLYGDLTLAEYNGEKMVWSGFGKIVDIEWKTK
ncbi:hypothetical protein JGH11_13905 [Dysgonomonas sp. Marseille-P4677]|uniref:PKD-like family lipoprotein n=1 Tax=Dysgonomonas sp. Marseille-P4677 TaxID=2364790 RepID=UPI001911AFAB|nr:PKD-like family lipoprotein [Dysgonomonas sp. Marseille-P4677]MBK5721970.1 hypothetical protein [Dysgonomonas sp. Marseille-P4677]